MEKTELVKIINYIVEQGVQAIKSNTEEQQIIIDYVAVFSKNDDEFNKLESAAELLGEEIDKETARTGRTFQLNEPIKTLDGYLELIKIRKPDNTRSQRGAPDFKVKNYQEFKNKYLQSSGNFTLMIRKDYEMIEIKGVDVLVYIPSKIVGERIKN